MRNRAITATGSGGMRLSQRQAGIARVRGQHEAKHILHEAKHRQGQEDDREARSRDDGKLHGSPSDGVRRRRAWTFALTLVAIQLGLMFVGALMPTPLYPLYRQAFGFSGIVL